MSHEQVAIEVIHWLGFACLLASIVVKFIPTPQEIKANWYQIFYNTLRRMSVNSSWQPKREAGK